MINTLATGAVGVSYGMALFFQAFMGMAQMVGIPQQNIRAAQDLGEVQVVWTQSGFIVAANGDKQLVEPCFVDEEIRHLDSRQMMYWLGLAKDISFDGNTITMVKRTHEEFQEEFDKASEGVQFQQLDEESAAEVKRQLTDQGGYLEVVQLNDGTFAIHAKHRLPGGGGIGGSIGAWIGYFGTHIVAQGAISIVTAGVAVVCPPAAPAVYAGLQMGAATIVQPVAVATGAVLGVTAAVITGPV